MKKLLFVLAVFTAITSCSNNDDESTPQDAGYTSSITVSNVSFAPFSAEDAKTSAGYGAPDIHERSFDLQDPATSAKIMVHIVAHNLDATGLYHASADPATENYLDGRYEIDGAVYVFSSDSSISLEDNDNLHYKITFQNITATNALTQESVTISGSFEGTFTDNPLEL